VSSSPSSAETVLDVACGYGRWGCLIRSNFWEAGLSRPPDVDGMDAFEGEYRSVRIDESIPAGVASGAALAAQRHVGYGPGM
jgi:hypothetical protein